MEERQPRITQKLLLRTAVLLFGAAALVLGYQWLRDRGGDIDLPAQADTAGMIAAVQILDEGAQAVLIDKDGKVLPSPGYRPGATDRDIVWRPDGHRVYFSSDREEGAFNIYRWNPASNKVERRSLGTIGKAAPSFWAGDTGGDAKPLIAYSGMVWELDPKEAKGVQLMPPPASQDASQLDRGEGEAESLGSYGAGAELKVREARWAKDKKFIVAVRKVEQGEMLVIQNLEDQTRPPEPIAQGQRISFDVNPANGQVVYAVMDFQFPEGQPIPQQLLKNGKATKPFLHYVGMLDPASRENTGIITASKDNKVCFWSPAISPDGSMMALVLGVYHGSGDFEPLELAAMPANQNAASMGATRITKGAIYEPSWHPNGNTIAYVMRDADGKRRIYTINRDGSGARQVSSGDANFGSPRFSPQSK